jgi:heme/copper-type cytochrome/quinol oxidase subunit 2
MRHSTSKVVLGGAIVAAATIAGTRWMLSLLPPEAEATAASEEASFLAHLLMPLSVALFLIVAIALVAAVVRIVAALRRRE